MRILIVEDSTPIRLYLAKSIADLGIDCIQAKSGEEAFAGYRQGNPDVILLDIELPDMSGFDIARIIRAEESRTDRSDWTPIIFLTGMASDESLAAGIAAGGDDYLVKPVSAVVLAAKITAMQRIRHMREQLLEVTRQLEAANLKLHALAAADGLTGLANRRHLDEQLDREWRRAHREDNAISVIMIDVDHFKAFNDTYGHQHGDDCLRRVAGALGQGARRPGDLAARYGGEEFAVVLPTTPSEGARLVAAGIKNAIAALGIEHSNSSAANHVTASLGVATAFPKQFASDQAALLKLADQALYEAKHRGRNRVVWVDATTGQQRLASAA
jgi:diguanylate cyclase (GGDEF)-like protein